MALLVDYAALSYYWLSLLRTTKWLVVYSASVAEQGPTNHLGACDSNFIQSRAVARAIGALYRGTIDNGCVLVGSVVGFGRKV